MTSELHKNDTELQIEQKELRSLEERKTQMPGCLVCFRTMFRADLRIYEDDLPFGGELLQVNGNETEGEGGYRV